MTDVRVQARPLCGCARRILVSGLFWLAAVGLAAPATAQQTREEALRAEREKKAQTVQPYKPSALERGVLKVENDRILERLFLPSEGFTPRIGSFTRGGGFALGIGYVNRTLLNRRMEFGISGAVSTKAYFFGEASLRFPGLARGRAFAAINARRRDFTQEDFFGLGPDSIRPDRVSYAYRDTEVEGLLGYQVNRFLGSSASVAWVHPSIGHGRDERFPSIEELFTPDEAPGVDEQPDYLRYRGILDLNYSTPIGNPRAGGRYIVSYSFFDDQDFHRYSFGRLDLDFRQYLPFLQQRRVLALRAALSTAHTSGANEMPFYYQLTLGGSDSLRGFREFRFRDEHMLVLQAEYRVEIFPALDFALFGDAGKVATKASDLNFDNLESDYGFGFRFGTFRGIFLRVDAAFGSRDGKRYWLRFGHVF
jgi:outer membrane protein assembly factor BamA